MPAIFQIKLSHLDYVDFFPGADFHLGSPQCDEEMIQHYVSFIKRNDQAFWVGVGDWTNNNITGSAGTPYEDILSPRKQIERAVELFWPIKDKGWGVIAGNHNHRTRRAVGLDPDEWIARELDVPYWGDSAFINIIIKNKSWSIYAHHCTGGGRTAGGKLNAIHRLGDTAPVVDFIIGAHVHVAGISGSRYASMRGPNSPKKENKLFLNTRRTIQVGSTLNWEGSYAETKAMPPAVKELVWLRLKGLSGGKDSKTIGREEFEYHIFSG